MLGSSPNLYQKATNPFTPVCRVLFLMPAHRFSPALTLLSGFDRASAEAGRMVSKLSKPSGQLRRRVSRNSERRTANATATSE